MRRKRLILMTLLGAGGLCLTFLMGGCAEMIHWGDEWMAVTGPIADLGKEIVGYQEAY